MIWLLLLPIVIIFYYLFLNKRRNNLGSDSSLSSNASDSFPLALSDQSLKLKKKLGLGTGTNLITLSIIEEELYSESCRKTLDEVLLKLSAISKIIFVVKAENDNTQDNILSHIELFYPHFPVHHCLFYETTIGKNAIIRQLKPCLHIEYDREFYMNIKSHIQNVILLGENEVNSGGDLFAIRYLNDILISE